MFFNSFSTENQYSSSTSSFLKFMLYKKFTDWYFCNFELTIVLHIPVCTSWYLGLFNVSFWGLDVSCISQATFCGSTMGKKKGYHFSMADFEALGYHFCDTLLDYCDPDNTKVRNQILLFCDGHLKCINQQ